MMMREKGVGISRVVTLLIIAIIITNYVMVDTCAAAITSEEVVVAEHQVVQEQEQQRQVWLYNILLRGLGAGSTSTPYPGDEEGAMVDTTTTNNNNILQCAQASVVCSTDADCCPGLFCIFTHGGISLGYKCKRCSRQGESCAQGNKCCAGLTCSGFFIPTCEK